MARLTTVRAMPDPFAESFKRMKADDRGLWDAIQKANGGGIPVPNDNYNRERDEMGFFEPVTASKLRRMKCRAM